MNSAAIEPNENTRQNLHATCVSFGEKGILITGKSGAGKSTLALQLTALGATLVSDDLTHLKSENGNLMAYAPETMQGIIEARGVGLLRVPFRKDTLVQLVVDLDCAEHKRLPNLHETTLLGVVVQTIFKVDGPQFPIAIQTLVQSGRFNE